MKSIEDLKLTCVDEDIKSWVRHIYFEYNGEEQYVRLYYEEDFGYEIISKELTESFSEALETWHETTEELFESMLDDLSWKEARKGTNLMEQNKMIILAGELLELHQDEKIDLTTWANAREFVECFLIMKVGETE